jgi:hypothetical protein
MVEIAAVKYVFAGHMDGDDWNWLVDNFGLDEDGCIVVDEETIQEVAKEGKTELASFLHEILKKNGEIGIRAF